MNALPLAAACASTCSSTPASAAGAPKLDADGQDAHVLDAGVGKQPFDVPLAEQVQRGEQQRRDPEDQQHVARETRPECGLGHLVEPQDRVEADRQQRARQQRGHRCRCLGVRVWKPGVHRHQAHLGAEAEHREHERELHSRVRQPAGHRQQLRSRGRRTGRGCARPRSRRRSWPAAPGPGQSRQAARTSRLPQRLRRCPRSPPAAPRRRW